MNENDIQTQMEQARQEIEKHAVAAYALLPPTLAFYGFESIGIQLKGLKQKYEAEEWRQVCYILLGLRSTNDFSSKLCHHIEELDRLFNFTDALVTCSL